MENTTVVLLGIGLLIFYFAIFAIAIASYVVNSLGVYRLATRYQMDSPWMAWIPIVSDWLIGKLTEAHDARKGAKRKWGTVMLVLSLINVCGLVVFFIVYFIMVFSIAAQAMISTGDAAAAMGIFSVLIMIVAIAMALAATAYTACSYICIYKNIEVIAPEKTIKYFLLSMLVPLAYGIILMKCCKKGYIEPMENTAKVMQQDIPLDMPVVNEPMAEVPQVAETSAAMEKQDAGQSVDFEYNMIAEEVTEEK